MAAATSDHIHAVTRLGPPEDDVAAPARVVSGTGVARLWNTFTGAEGRFHAGQWQAEPGIRRVDYTETELCVIVEGRVRLSGEDGSVAEFGPGEGFVIASGFRGTWESIGRVTKFYAILEPEA